MINQITTVMEVMLQEHLTGERERDSFQNHAIHTMHPKENVTMTTFKRTNAEQTI